MKLHLIKTLQGLKPSYDSDLIKYSKLKLNEEYLCDITQPRSYRFHRKFFALLNLCFSNQEKYDTFEDLRAVLIMKAGFYKTIETEKGVIYLPKSISFASMDNHEFEDVYSKVLDVIIKELGTTEQDIMEQLIDFM